VSCARAALAGLKPTQHRTSMAERCGSSTAASASPTPNRLSGAVSERGWSGRRVSNPRHSAWKAGAAMRCGAPRGGASISSPVIVSWKTREPIESLGVETRPPEPLRIAVVTASSGERHPMLGHVRPLEEGLPWPLRDSVADAAGQGRGECPGAEVRVTVERTRAGGVVESAGPAGDGPMAGAVVLVRSGRAGHVLADNRE
jgi:hypothetical protein